MGLQRKCARYALCRCYQGQTWARLAVSESHAQPHQEDPVSASRRLAEAAGADADTAHDPTKLVAFLRTVPAKELFTKYLNSINPKVCPTPKLCLYFY